MVEAGTAVSPVRGVRLPLNASLLRPEIEPHRAVRVHGAATVSFYEWTGDQLVELDEGAAELIGQAAKPGDLLVALLHRPHGEPTWQRVLRSTFGIDAPASGGVALGAVVLCAVHDDTDVGARTRWIAWGFGSGSRAIRRDGVDGRFGMITALNRIVGDDEKFEGVRKLQYRTPGPYVHHTGHIAPRDTPFDAFPANRRRDLFSAVGGRPAGDDVAQVFGARSLRSRGRIATAADFAALAQAAFDDFRSGNYRDHFGFVDNMVAVDDLELLEKLRAALVDHLRAGDDNVDVFLPDDLVAFDDERSIQYILYPGERLSSASRTTLTVDMLCAHFPADTPIQGVLDADLRLIDADGEEIERVSVIECLAADLSLGDDRYLLYDGTFCRVDTTFLDGVHAELDALERSALAFPSYGGGAEGTWNRDASTQQPDSFVCLDEQFIQLPGETKFEACDLLALDGALIHAKRKGRSSALTYLFTQAERACQMLVSVPDARSQLRDLVAAAAPPEQLRRAHEVVDLLELPRPGVEVVFVILGDWRGRTVRNLPLLAKVSLVETARRISQLGFRVTIAEVDSVARFN